MVAHPPAAPGAGPWVDSNMPLRRIRDSIPAKHFICIRHAHASQQAKQECSGGEPIHGIPRFWWKG
jgi:hypothetical protein